MGHLYQHAQKLSMTVLCLLQPGPAKRGGANQEVVFDPASALTLFKVYIIYIMRQTHNYAMGLTLFNASPLPLLLHPWLEDYRQVIVDEKSPVPVSRIKSDPKPVRDGKTPQRRNVGKKKGPVQGLSVWEWLLERISLLFSGWPGQLRSASGTCPDIRRNRRHRRCPLP